MVSDNVELRMKMLEIQRRSEAEMEREQKDRARKTLLKRRAQLLMKLSGTLSGGRVDGAPALFAGVLRSSSWRALHCLCR